jgi:hypothetical protein
VVVHLGFVARAALHRASTLVGIGVGLHGTIRHNTITSLRLRIHAATHGASGAIAGGRSLSKGQRAQEEGTGSGNKNLSGFHETMGLETGRGKEATDGHPCSGYLLVRQVAIRRMPIALDDHPPR